ncbi:sterol desaturase family protein [Streptomyces microflavus]|uniref:sterol desaturase family protein n=1 Tax=Streptomyces microflavus TaxID=1919 RepID=UPI00365DCED3
MVRTLGHRARRRAAVTAGSSLRVGVTWLTFPLILLAQDFCYYRMHREHHQRVLWASHVVHHSSVRYNFSTAVRQPWTGPTSQLFFIPLVLAGVPPWAVLVCGGINTLSQFWLHTDQTRCASSPTNTRPSAGPLPGLRPGGTGPGSSWPGPIGGPHRERAPAREDLTSCGRKE